MGKRMTFFLLMVLASASLNAQCNFDQEMPFIKFNGIAPAPWAIDGLITDWQTIFAYPANNSLESVDLDHPAPAGDIRKLAHTYDSKNVYFYFRRLDNSGNPPSYYFFCDLNFDGYMNAGEPVIGGRFSGNSPITLFSYQVDPTTNVSGKGNIMYDLATTKTDGFSMKGTTQRIFNSNQVPAAYALQNGEKFGAAVTEDGFGVELAVPWRFLRNWVTNSAALVAGNALAYHLSLQSGPSNANFTYSLNNVTDNMANCCRQLNYLPLPTPAYSFSHTTSGLNINASFSFHNLTNQPIKAGIYTISFTNLTGTGINPFQPGFINVYIDNVPLVFDDGSYNSDGTISYINYSSSGAGPGSTQSQNIRVEIPAGSPVTGYKVSLNPLSASYNLYFLDCDFSSALGGGVGGPPIILDVTTENRNRGNLGIDNGANTNELLTVYPNPSRGETNVALPAGGKGVLRIEDMSGKLIRQISVNKPTAVISDLHPGFYMVRFISSVSGKIYQSKLMVH